MSTLPAPATPSSPVLAWREIQAGFAGMLISLAPVLTLGLLAFAALGAQAAPLGIPAALVSSVVGGAVFALLARGPMAAGGPSAAPVLVLGTLVARVAADPEFAVGDPAAVALLLALVAAAVVSMGLLQIVLGLSGLVRFAKYVPQPVLAGFMNGVALLALLAVLPLLFGWPVGALQISGWTAMPKIQPATVAVGLFTLAIVLGLPRLNPRLPATLIGLLAGTGAYAALHAMAPQATLGPLTGTLPMSWPHAATLAPFFDGADNPLLQRHLGAALAAGLVMALIGTLELVLNSLAMDQACYSRTEPRREVLALGAANVASGLMGGLPLLLLRPRALHMLQAGGRSRAGLYICCGLFAVLGLVAAPVLSLLPQVVLGGLMVKVYFLSTDRWSIQLAAQWWRGQREADAQLALGVVGLVCAITLLLGFPAAVAAGAVLSMLLFIRSMNRSLVRTRFTGDALPSRRIYAAADEARLHTLRAHITVLELEGALFFGTADRVADLADTLDAHCHTLVLDFRRVSLIDASGAVVLSQLSRRLRDRKVTLLLAGVSVHNRHGRMLAQFAGDGFAAGDRAVPWPSRHRDEDGAGDARIVEGGALGGERAERSAHHHVRTRETLTFEHIERSAGVPRFVQTEGGDGIAALAVVTQVDARRGPAEGGEAAAPFGDAVERAVAQQAVQDQHRALDRVGQAHRPAADGGAVARGRRQRGDARQCGQFPSALGDDRREQQAGDAGGEPALGPGWRLTGHGRMVMAKPDAASVSTRNQNEPSTAAGSAVAAGLRTTALVSS